MKSLNKNMKESRTCIEGSGPGPKGGPKLSINYIIIYNYIKLYIIIYNYV